MPSYGSLVDRNSAVDTSVGVVENMNRQGSRGLFAPFILSVQFENLRMTGVERTFPAIRHLPLLYSELACNRQVSK